MAWKPHWHKGSPKEDWADDIRNDLEKAFPGRAKIGDCELKSLTRLSRGDVMMLAELISDLTSSKGEAS